MTTMLLDLGRSVYTDDFEMPFLERTAEFYGVSPGPEGWCGAAPGCYRSAQLATLGLGRAGEAKCCVS